MARRETFSQWFDAQLLQAGLSGKELAMRVGVSEATISRVRNGRVPLSPRMKARLSLALNAKLGDIPKLETKVISNTVPLWTIQHSVPGQAFVNYALHHGLFSARDVFLKELPDRDAGLRYSVKYYSSIEERLAQGHVVLAVGTELDFQKNGLRSSASIFSHTYRGYHLVTRASTALPTINDVPQHQRMLMLKFLLEQLENAHIWRKGFDRFSWQSVVDLTFLKTLRNLSSEITGVEDHHDFEPMRFSNKAGLHSLQSFGQQGADFALVDPGTLAEVYAHPEDYKVVLSLDSILKAFQGLTADAPLSLMAHLKKLYRTDNASVAITRFKDHWLERLSALELPVYWHVFCPEGFNPLERQQLVDKIAGVVQDLQQTLAAPHLRYKVFADVKQYCDGRACPVSGVADMESFQLAMTDAYGGL